MGSIRTMLVYRAIYDNRVDTHLNFKNKVVTRQLQIFPSCHQYFEVVKVVGYFKVVEVATNQFSSFLSGYERISKLSKLLQVNF